MPQGPAAINTTPNLRSRLNISASVVIKPSPGKVLTVLVQEAGSAPGGVHDCASVGAAADANLIIGIPNEVGPVEIGFPFTTALTLIVGTDQVLAISWQ